MKVVINRCFGGFGLSDAAYLRMIDLGIPVRKYIEQARDPVTGLYLPEPRNDGDVIFDCELNEDDGSPLNAHSLRKLTGNRFSESWIRDSDYTQAGKMRYRGRFHSAVIKAVESLGEAANGRFSKLKIVEVPDDVEWDIKDYDGMESIHEVHREWT